MNDTYIALGMTFEGGAGGDVQSALVGRATILECDPNLADPEPTERPRKPVQANPRKPVNARGGR